MLHFTCSEQRGAELEYLEELRVPEAGGDLPVLGEAPAGVCLGDLVHLADQLGQQLDSHHAVLGWALQELRHVADDGSEQKLVLVAVEPAELGDAREESDHALDNELGQLGLSPEVVEDVVPDVHPAAQLQALGGPTDQLGDGGGGQQLRVRRVSSL